MTESLGTYLSFYKVVLVYSSEVAETKEGFNLHLGNLKMFYTQKYINLKT